MNQFIFCVLVDGQIQFGTFQARDGSAARKFLEERYAGRDVKKLNFKGVAHKAFDFDVIEGVWNES